VSWIFPEVPPHWRTLAGRFVPVFLLTEQLKPAVVAGTIPWPWQP